MIASLLSHGADPNLSDDTGCSPIFLTAKHGHLQATRALLHAQASVHAVDSVGCTCIMLAASRGHLDVVRLLLIYGADPILENRSGLTALDHARVGMHGVALDVMLQSCMPLLSALEPQDVSHKVQRSASVSHPIVVNDTDPAYTDSWAAHQKALYCRLNQEIVTSIYERLIDFKHLKDRKTTHDGVIESAVDTGLVSKAQGDSEVVLSPEIMTGVYARLINFKVSK